MGVGGGMKGRGRERWIGCKVKFNKFSEQRQQSISRGQGKRSRKRLKMKSKPGLAGS